MLTMTPAAVDTIIQSALKEAEGILAERNRTDIRPTLDTPKKVNHGYGQITFLTNEDRKAFTVHPSVSVQNILEDLTENGRTVRSIMEDVVDSVLHCLETHVEDVRHMEFISLCKNPTDELKPFILDNVFFCLAGKEKNKSLLNETEKKSMPVYREFLDMAVFYKIDLGKIPTGGQYSATITNGLLKEAGLTEEELFTASLENRKKTPCQMMPLCEAWLQIAGISDKGSFLSESEILTGKKDASGIRDHAYAILSPDNPYNACVLLDNDLMDAIGRAAGFTSFYVLPSSVHEIIIAKTGDADIERGYRNMIKGINLQTLQDEDILTDSLYLYDTAERKLSIL